MARRTEAQAEKIADGEGGDSVGTIRPQPRRSPPLGDQRGDGAIDRRAARIAPVQIGNEDLKLAEGLVIQFPVHPA